MNKLPLDECLLEQINKYLDNKQKYLLLQLPESMSLIFVRVFVKPVDRIVITDINFIDLDKAIPIFTATLELLQHRKEKFELLLTTGCSEKSGNTTRLWGVIDNWEYQFCPIKEEHWYWWNRVTPKFGTNTK